MLRPDDRAGLKAHAKETLHAHAPHIYLISLIFLAMNSAPNVVLNLRTYEQMATAGTIERALEIYQNSNLAQVGLPLTIATLLLNLFLHLLLCGYHLYALRAVRSEETGGVETLFSCFRQVSRFVVAYLLTNLFVFLWSLLFIIPGIVATLAYSQTIYIMLDNPDIRPMEAIRASKQMMRGHKGEYFVLSLSFLGWTFLSLFTFGLLNIWLNPYQMLTYANYYNALSGWAPLSTGEPEAPEFTVEDWWKQ